MKRIKLHDMVSGVQYIVVRESPVALFQTGDHVYLTSDFRIMNHQAFGWVLQQEAAERFPGCEVAIDVCAYRKQIAKYEALIQKYRGILKDHGVDED